MSSTFLRVWKPNRFAQTRKKVGSKLKWPGNGIDSQRLSGPSDYAKGKILNKLVTDGHEIFAGQGIIVID
jgi:hypothetical protein